MTGMEKEDTLMRLLPFAFIVVLGGMSLAMFMTSATLASQAAPVAEVSVDEVAR